MSFRALYPIGFLVRSVLILAALSFAACLSAAGQATFGARQDFPAGQSPSGVFAGPLTATQAIVDIATVNTASSDVTILLGNGDTTFKAPVSYKVGQSPVAFTAAAFNTNNNAFTDFAVVNQIDSTLSVLLDQGNGAFTVKPAISLGTGFSMPNAIASGDFDADGKVDVAVTAAQAGGFAVLVLLGNGDGTFGAPSSFTVGDSPIALAAADLDGDSKLDLVSANSVSDTLTVLLGQGDGSFSSPITSPAGSVPSAAISLVVADFNLDSNLDVAVGSSLLPGNGDGTFLTAAAINTSGGMAAASSDFNQDGIPDLLALSGPGVSPGVVSILFGKGDGSFNDPSNFDVAGGAVAAVTGPLSDPTRSFLVTANQTAGTVSVVVGHPDGSFDVVKTISATADANTYGSLTAADFTNDGRTDLGGIFQVAGAAGGVDLFPGSVGGPGAPRYSPLHSTASAPALAGASGDFNNDGNLDLAVISGGQVAILFGNADSTFQPEVDYSAGTGPASIATADFDLDGNADLAVTNSSGEITVLFGNPDGTFGSSQSFAAGENPVAVVTGDFNGDGKADLAVANNGADGKGLTVLIGNGTGTFQPAVSYSFVPAATSLAVGDLDGNSPDLVLANSSPGANPPNTVYIVHCDNHGGFSPGTTPTLTAGSQPVALAIADMDLDGNNEILVLNQAWSDVTIFSGDGFGNFSSANSRNWGVNGATAFVTGDFDGDGGPDIAVSSGSIISILQSELSGPVAAVPSSVALGNVGTGLSKTQTFVLNNTGTADLTITSIGIAGAQQENFSQTNSCGSIVLKGAECTISVTFTPPSLGFNSATLTISDNATGSPHTVRLSGTGVAAVPAVRLSTTSLIFAATIVGDTAPAKTVTVTNNGAVTLNITSIALTGADPADYLLTSSTSPCGSTLAVNASCVIAVEFIPTAAGTRTASITLTDDAADSPQTITLSGTGQAPVVTLSVTSIDFGDVFIGNGAVSSTVLLTNTGDAQLSITSITITGASASDFSESDTCNGIVVVGGTCSLQASFLPSVAGIRTATLSINDSAAGSPHTVSLTGTAVATAIGLAVAPGTPASITIPSGSTASYTMSIGGKGVTGTAAISCGDVPPGGGCTVPSTVDFSDTSTSTFTVTVETTSRTSAASIGGNSVWMWAFGLVGIVLLPTRRSRIWRNTATVILLLTTLLLPSCGGGSSQVNPNGTPAGSYTVSVRATAANAGSETVNLTLVVQ